MADILQPKTKSTGHRRSTRVDLTPMVDLGFLLITFFVFTTTMSQATAMNMTEPNDSHTTRDLICESCALTIMAGENNKLYYYEGLEENAVYNKVSYSVSGLRDLIMDKKRSAAKTGNEIILIVKPGEKASFKNLVDIIDESNICGVKRYYMAELSEREGDFLFLNAESQSR